MDDSKVTEDAEDSSAATVGLFADINGNATCAVTPRPEIARNCVVSPNVRCLSCAPATIAAARGCSESRSALAVIASRSSGILCHFPSGNTSVNDGVPAVIVPVLSAATALIFCRRFQCFGERINTPICAARPVETVTESGVARPTRRHAISGTRGRNHNACTTRGSGPNANHNAHDHTAISTTIGRNCLKSYPPCAAPALLSFARIPPIR